MKLLVNWKGISEAFKPYIQQVVDRVSSNPELTKAFQARGLSTITVNFSSAPGGKEALKF